MSLNSEPADPAERAELHLPAKSYADAVEDALEVEVPPIDEDAGMSCQRSGQHGALAKD